MMMFPTLSLIPAKLFRICLALGGLSLAGCLQLEQTVMLNPDNSGKAVIKASMINPMAGMMEGLAGQAGKNAPEGTAGDLTQLMGAEMAKVFASGILRDSKGIDAWDQVKYGSTKEGKFTFEGVAYFPDFNAFSITTSAHAEGMGELPAFFRSERSANGDWLVRALVDEPKPADAARERLPIPAAEIDAAIKEVRENWSALEAIAAPMMKDAKAVLRIQVAGTIRECKGWQQTSPQVATLETDMSKVLANVGELIKDDAALRQAMTEGRVNEEGFPEPDFAQLRKLLFNGEDKAEIVITPGAPQFDYAAEVAKAKAAMPEDLKALLDQSR